MSEINEELLNDFFNTSDKLRNLMQQLSPGKERFKMATRLQIRTMKYLFINPETTVGDLAKELVMSSGAIAQLLDRLEGYGWIKRDNDPEDRRVIRLSLTQEGRKQIKEIGRLFIKEKIQSFLSLIREEDLKTLVEIQKRIIKNIEEKGLPVEEDNDLRRQMKERMKERIKDRIKDRMQSHWGSMFGPIY